MNSSLNINESNHLPKLTFKYALKQVFKNHLFIFFSFVNLFIPFYATIISALNKPNGLIDVIGVGLSTSFITIFNQFLFILSLCIIFIFEKQKSVSIENQIDRNSVSLIIAITSFISIFLFAGTSFLYIQFSGIYKNISSSVSLGFVYVSIVCPSLFFNAFTYLNIMYKHINNNHQMSSLMLFAFFIINIILIPTFGVLIPWPKKLTTFGVGLGILISSFISFIFMEFMNFKYKHMIFTLNWQVTKFFLMKIRNFAFNFLLSTIMKSILIMTIALSLSLSSRPGTPIALMVVKIIWYNSLFFCGFFVDGLLYAIEFTRLDYLSKNNKKERIDFSIWNKFILMGSLGTLFICVIFNFCAMPLADLYTENQTDITNINIMPSTWPYSKNIALEVKKYLWCTDGVANFNIFKETGKIVYSPVCFSLMYTTIYHVVINTTKLMSFVDIKLDQEFSWKKLISNFIVISIVMIFVVVFSIVPTQIGYYKAFPGIDNFSFSLMVIALVLFTLTILTHIKKMQYFKKIVF